MKSFKENIDEVSPPGWKKTVKAMKKHKEIDNPWALAWHMKNKGYTSHKESVELDEAKVGDVEFTYPTTGQAKAFSNTLVMGGVEGVVVKRGKTVIFNISDLNKADKMGRKTLADLAQTARSNKAIIKSHGFTVESVELDKDNTAAVAKQVKQAVKQYVSGKLTVRSKGGKTRFIMVLAKDGIDNELRKRVLKVVAPNANVRDMNNISYGNISDRIISASVDHWVKALGIKV